MRKFLILLLIALAGCETPSDCTDRYFSDKFKSHILFNEGSYWVYDDTLNGISDSICLVYQSLEFKQRCTVSSPPQELVQQRFTSSYFKGDNNYNWSAMGSADLNEYIGNSLVGGYMDIEGVAIDSMLIGGVLYKDVLEFSMFNNKYYRAKGIGLIKKEIYSSNPDDRIFNFELKRYKLK
jgi:hypothetical protein